MQVDCKSEFSQVQVKGKAGGGGLKSDPSEVPWNWPWEIEARADWSCGTRFQMAWSVLDSVRC